MANYFKQLNEAFDKKYGLNGVVESKRKLKEANTDWYSMEWDDQVKAIKRFVKNYRGSKVFEDFAASVGADVDEVVDAFADLEAFGVIDIPKKIQIDDKYRNDDIYESKRRTKKPIKEDGAEDFLDGISDSILTHLYDFIFDDVADAAADLGSLPDYLPMTGEEAHNNFVDAVYKLAEAAFIKYCVDSRDDDVDEGLKEDKKPSEGNAIDRYQRWVDFDMAHYGKISERTQQMVNKAGYQIIKDDHGDYEVAAGHFE